MDDNLVEKMKALDRNYILQQVETKNTKEIESFDVADFYVVYTPLVIGDTGILAVIPKDELYVGFSGYKHVFLFILIAGLVLFIILYFLIPEYFSRPVTQLLEQMKGIREPGEDRKVDARGYREISQISDGVNDMMERITPVSYTHLDVYKRQLLCIFQNTLLKFFSVIINQLTGKNDESFSFFLTKFLETAI